MLSAGIVGLGGWGRTLVRAVQGGDRPPSESIRFVRGVTRTPEKATDFARETGIPVTADFGALLADPAIDAVVLATPHSQHVAQVQAAAAAGKHVMVEKPLALTAADAEAAFDACERAAVVLAVAHNRRFLPAFAALAEMVADAALGEILHVEGNFSGPSRQRHAASSWRTRPGESPAGGMTGKGLHVTDLMIALFGPVVEVDARSLRQAPDAGLDDTTVMLLRFASGMTGYLATLTATAEIWRLQVFGSAGWIEMRDPDLLVRKTLERAALEQRFAPCDIERAELEAFADAVTSGRPFPVRREQAVHNIALLEAVTRSAGEGGPVAVAATPPAALRRGGSR